MIAHVCVYIYAHYAYIYIYMYLCMYGWMHACMYSTPFDNTKPLPFIDVWSYGTPLLWGMHLGPCWDPPGSPGDSTKMMTQRLHPNYRHRGSLWSLCSLKSKPTKRIEPQSAPASAETERSSLWLETLINKNHWFPFEIFFVINTRVAIQTSLAMSNQFGPKTRGPSSPRGITAHGSLGPG